MTKEQYSAIKKSFDALKLKVVESPMRRNDFESGTKAFAIKVTVPSFTFLVPQVSDEELKKGIEASAKKK